MDDLNSNKITMDDVLDGLAPEYSTMFASLLSVMRVQEIKEEAKIRKQSQAPHGPRINLERPKTPDQPTFPSNPDFSGSSTQSKDEESIKLLLDHLFKNTMSVLRSNFRKISWSRSACDIELYKRYFLKLLSLKSSDRDKTTFRLGYQSIVAINDGGLGITYNTGQRFKTWQPGNITRPVLSLEVIPLARKF